MSYSMVVRDIQMETENKGPGKGCGGDPRVPRTEPGNRRALGRVTSQGFRGGFGSLERQREVEEARNATNI